ncbi:DUF721 domain-containing protein [Microbaculum marinum]|uniref:DciA family protein n=1 Tax=Microbaculum marinum TaxID=1764581 RepID=A0AAW9RS47_9HYPH
MERRNRPSPAYGPVRLDRIAEPLLDPVVARAGFSSTQVIAAWPEIVGPELAARSRPEKLRWPRRQAEGEEATAEGATLVVRAEGFEALEIQHMSSNIAARINAIFGWRAVTRVSIRQGPVESRSGTAAANPGTLPSALPDAENAAADERLATVEDHDLRSALARLGARVSAATDAD